MTLSVGRKILLATDEAIANAAQHLFDGRLIGLPTETVYGLAARGDDANAVHQIFAAKNRPHSNPLILHVASAADAKSLMSEVHSSHLQRRFECLSVFWPGPLTIIFSRSREILDCVTAGGDTVAIRVPDHPVALAVLRQLAKIAGRVVPVAAPSANQANYVSPTTARHVADGLGEHVSMILDGGACRVGLESTIVLLPADDSTPRVLRSGAISPGQLAEALGELVIGPNTEPSHPVEVAAPGQFAKHYSPRTPLRLLPGDRPSPPHYRKTDRVLSVVFGPIADSPRQDPQFVWSFNDDGRLETAAAQLYAVLRRADALGFDTIEVYGCEEVGLGVAIMDRLRRASHQD